MFSSIKVCIGECMTSTDDSVAPLGLAEFAQCIQSIRGRRVVLDSDLAAFYGETTKRFNQQVSRNRQRFPEDFVFQLSTEEAASLRLQIATLNRRRGQHRKFLPYAFTEHGAIMVATLLRSSRATQMSIHVVRAFVEMRALVKSSRELSAKVNHLERKVAVHDREIAELADSMGQLLAAPSPEHERRPIGFIAPGENAAPYVKSRPKAKTPQKAGSG